MSHITVVKTIFRDVDALRSACEALGLTLGQSGAVRTYGERATADHVITLPGRYDIGFKLETDGSLSAVCDGEVLSEFNTGRNADAHRLVGPGLERLKQEYAIAIAQSQARRSGLSVSRRAALEGEEAGAVYITLRR